MKLTILRKGEMHMFQRKIYSKILEWKRESDGKTALLIEGARRVGKSTVAEEFARNEYKSYILIDFSKASREVRELFDDISDLNYVFLRLQLIYGTDLHERDSVIIFDEVQLCPMARQAIKHLVKDHRYDYIETGSLISIKKNIKDILIPSEERKISMFPMDYEEFLWAIDDTSTSKLLPEVLEKRMSVGDAAHRKLMRDFRLYMLVGGMPKPIAAYLENNRNFVAADIEKRDILSLYRNDIGKADLKYRSRVSSIFEQIPAFLSLHEKRVRLSNIESHANYPMYQDTFFWLSNSMMTNECFNCNDPNVGLSLNEDRTFIKCYMGDTGLLVSLAFTESEIAEGELYKQILHDNLSINEGMLFENAIAQCLVANGYKLFFYTHYNEEKHRNDIEIDFLISNGSITKPKIYPIEVKSGKRYTTTSIEKFVTQYRKRVGKAYIIHPKNLSVKGDIICIPSYMTMCL